MKKIRIRSLTLILTVLFAFILGIAGIALTFRKSTAAVKAEAETAVATADDGESGIMPLASTALKRPVFYTESGTNEDGSPKFAAVAGGAYSTSFTYSTTQSHFVQLQGYDPATMTYALSDTTYMAAVEDAAAKTLTVTFKDKTPATLAASTYKITVKLRPNESGTVENTWDNLFTNDQIYEVSFGKLKVAAPTFWQVVKTTGDDGTATTAEERVSFRRAP